MQAWMWRLTDDHAVIYTDDRATLKALFAYSRFPHQDLSRATTYERKNGRVFAWQFTFPVSAWNGVVRHLGRASITMLDQERWITADEAAVVAPALVEQPKKGKKGRPAAAAVVKEEPPVAKRARKPAPRPVADLSQPLQPMVGAGSKARTVKSRIVPAEPLAAPAPQITGAAETKSPTKKAPAPASAATEGRTVKGDPKEARGTKESALKTLTSSAASSPASPRKTSAVPEVQETELAGKVRAGARAKPVVVLPPPVTAAKPAPEPPPAAVRAKKGKVAEPPPAPLREAGGGKRRSKDEERLLAELAEVQLRLAALTEKVPAATPKRSGRPKAGTSMASVPPAAQAAKPETSGSQRKPAGAGRKATKAVAPEPMLMAVSGRGGSAIAAAARETAESPAPRNRGPVARRKQD